MKGFIVLFRVDIQPILANSLPTSLEMVHARLWNMVFQVKTPLLARIQRFTSSLSKEIPFPAFSKKANYLLKLFLIQVSPAENVKLAWTTWSLSNNYSTLTTNVLLTTKPCSLGNKLRKHEEREYRCLWSKTWDLHDIHIVIIFCSNLAFAR